MRLTPNNISFYIVMLCLILTGTTSVFAQNAEMPRPIHRDDIIKGIQKNVKNEKQRAEEIASQKKSASITLKKLEDEIIPLSTSIQHTENMLLKLEKKIHDNEVEERELTEILKQNQKFLSDGILATLRLRRIPTETLFMQATSPLQTAQTAMLLERTIPSIKKRMDFLVEASMRLAALQQNLQEQYEEHSTSLARLEDKRRDIEEMISARQNAIKKLQGDYQVAQRNADALSKEAKSLKELVKKVRAENYQPPPQPEFKPSFASVLEIPSLRSSERKDPSWPVAGTLTISFGALDNYGAATPGVKIKTRPSALVTSPMQGIVRFAGDFKNYGQIVIIEHNDNWHSLIAGMAKIDAIVGQNVKSGEPVGRMSSQNASEQLLLYYELRYKGEPVNPSKKIKNLS